MAAEAVGLEDCGGALGELLGLAEAAAGAGFAPDFAGDLRGGGGGGGLAGDVSAAAQLEVISWTVRPAIERDRESLETMATLQERLP